MTLQRLRSPLFVPADQPRKIMKALASDADAVILDLEDSVAPSAKDAARDSLQAVLAESAHPHLVVRVNARGTPWYLPDLAEAVRLRPAGVMLPKCAGPDDLLALDHHLEALETAHGCQPGSIAVLALATETAASVLALGSYPKAAARLRALCFGAEDLSANLGIAPRGSDGAYPAPVRAARAAVLLAGAALGIPVLDTPYPDPADPAGMEREAAAAAADGFAGKLLIHPAQIAAANAAFTPLMEKIIWARAVRDGFAANPYAGVFALDGKMIDRPHLVLATRILEAAGEHPSDTSA
jgi:citrate lyase subunit beta/citryl-CoA lyase